MAGDRTPYERMLGVLRAHALLTTVPGGLERLADKLTAAIDEGPCDAVGPLLEPEPAMRICELRWGHKSGWHEATNADGVTKMRWYVVSMPTEDLDALQALADAATPGPWEAYYTLHGDPMIVPASNGYPSARIADVSVAPADYGRANCEWITAAVNAVPKLITEIRARADRGRP